MAEKKKGFDLAAALSSVSSLDTGDRPQLEYIDIDFIDPDPKNRKVDGIPELAQNIALIGLQQPLAVRPNPEADGRYIAVSGHRRRLAIKQLVDEGEDRFRMVPCLVAPPGMSDAMIRLMLLSGNLVTQGLTPAEMAEATKELEDAIYALKKEGKEFPGKVRDYVAKACGIAGNRVTRLKKIRENLIEELQAAWESGDLKESPAYAFAQQTPDVQRYIAQMMSRDSGANYRYWHEGSVTYWAGKVTKELGPRKGPKGTCESCDHRPDRFLRMLGSHLYDDHCQNGTCCHDCPNLGTCKYACPHLSGEVAKAQQAAKIKQAKEKEQKDKQNEDILAPKIRLWKRFGEARAAAGLTFEEYAKKADVRAFRREKKVADFEQGKKLTPSSGGLPYAGGDGVDEWRIQPLIKAADALGCSIDYLLCRTDEPGGMAVPAVAGEPLQYIPGQRHPARDGQLAVAKFNAAGLTRPMKSIVCWKKQGWCFLNGAAIDAECVGWLPLPDDEEAAQ